MPGSSDVLQAGILIVDDQDSNVRLLEFALRRAGYVAVASTTDPLRVTELHRQNRYTLILLDLQMPNMNGFEVMEALKNLEDEQRAAVLVLSGDPSQMVRVLEAGASGFLSKPFVLTEVLQRVQQLLEQVVSRSIGETASVPATGSSALSLLREIR